MKMKSNKVNDLSKEKGEYYKTLFCDDCLAAILKKQQQVGISDNMPTSFRQKAQMMNFGRKLRSKCKDCAERVRKNV